MTEQGDTTEATNQSEARSDEAEANPKEDEQKGRRVPSMDDTWTSSHSAEAIHERARLEELSSDELIDMILDLKGLKGKKLASSTGRMELEDASVSFGKLAFGTKITTDVQGYVSLPADAEQDPNRTWRIKLLSNNPTHQPLGIIVCSDVTLGRPLGDVHPDLDLTDYGATKAGVSRHHALFRPSNTNLFLIDLGSTNGTYYNGQRLSKGVAQTINDKDIISFGVLHFAVRIVEKPKRPGS